MKYKIGDHVQVQRGFFIVNCQIIGIDNDSEYPYIVEGLFTEGRTSDDYILGYANTTESLDRLHNIYGSKE